MEGIGKLGTEGNGRKCRNGRKWYGKEGIGKLGRRERGESTVMEGNVVERKE